MREDLKRALEENNTDIKNALERFLDNEELYERFLREFMYDPNFTGLKQALVSQNVEAAFDCAHTLKGVAANLGLDSIVITLDPLVELLRTGEITGTEQLYEELQKKYQKICQIIQNYPE